MPVKSFHEVIGHEAAIERLRRDISGRQMANAYLFVGPEGIGKATVARLVAVSMLCEREDTEDLPCGECKACRKAEKSNHPDFHPVTVEKGKRQIRIDQIRALQADLALKPYEARWKVAIMEEAGAMNEAAQNALLKTLEEPPGDALLILIAPAAQNLLPTIVSRCRIERFGPLKQEELARFLTKEKGLEEKEAFLVAGLAGGSVGRALDMDLKFVREERPKFLKSLGKLVMEDAPPSAEDVFEASESLAAAGESGLAMVNSWLNDIARVKLGDTKTVHTDLSDDLKALADRWSMKQIIKRFQATTYAHEGLAKNLNKALTYETLALALIGDS